MINKRGQFALIFLLLWTTSLLVSVSMVYGMTAFRMLNGNGDGEIPLTNPNDVGTVSIKYSLDNSQWNNVIDGQILEFSEGDVTTFYLRLYWDNTGSLYPRVRLKSGTTSIVEATYVGTGAHIWECQLTAQQIGTDSTQWFHFSFFGGSMMSVLWTGNSHIFGILIQTDAYTPPVTDETPPPIPLPDDVVGVAQMGMIMLVVFVHIIVLPIGFAIIGKVIK